MSVLFWYSRANYTQNQLPGDIFNSSSGSIKNYNGKAVRITNPGNGTRDLEDLGSWAEYQGQQTLKNQQAETAALNAAQAAKQEDFLGRFRTAIGAQEKLPDMAGRIGGELGLPNLQAVAGNAVQNIAAMPKQQTDATRGYNVNSNQLARIIGQKQAELAPQAQQAVTQQQNAENQLSTRLGYEVAQQQKELTPFTTEQSMLSEQLAREYSGFTTDKQNELQLVMQQISNGAALTQQELQNANNLAIAKMQYDNTKNDVSSQLMTVSAGSSVYNPSTGQFTQAPSNFKPLTGTAASGW